MQDVAGALLELVVNARQVVTDDAQAQHQHATEKNEQQNNGGKAIERFAIDFLQHGNTAEQQPDQ